MSMSQPACVASGRIQRPIKRPRTNVSPQQSSQCPKQPHPVSITILTLWILLSCLENHSIKNGYHLLPPVEGWKQRMEEYLQQGRNTWRKRRIAAFVPQQHASSSPLSLQRGGTMNHKDETMEEDNEEEDRSGRGDDDDNDENPTMDDVLPLDMEPAEEEGEGDAYDEEDPDDEDADKRTTATDETDDNPPPKRKRRASDVIVDLSSSPHEPAEDLRRVFWERKHEFLEDVAEAIQVNKKPPRPKRLLHILAPKIPALKHSPDITLRIISAQSDVDAGLAASLLATLAHVCELTSSHHHKRWSSNSDEKKNDAAREMLKERRLEQLVECLVCGVDVPKRTKEYLKLELDKEPTEEDTDSDDMLNKLLNNTAQDKENTKPIQEGLSIRDCARAAWGLVVLGAHRHETLSDVKVVDLIRALSLRARELLLRRMQLLCQDELLGNSAESQGGQTQQQKQDGKTHQPPRKMTLEERLKKEAQEIAQDAATVLWAFGCVRAVSGIRSTALFQVCATILCQNPTELRHRAQQEFLPLDNIGSNDVVEKLAMSDVTEEEVEPPRNKEEGEEIATDDDENNDVEKRLSEETSIAESDESKDDAPIVATNAAENDGTAVLVDFLSPNEVSDVLWALASHGEKEAVTQSKFETVEMSETATTLCDVAFDRALAWLKQDTQALEALDSREKENQHVGVVEHYEPDQSAVEREADSDHPQIENTEIETTTNAQQSTAAEDDVGTPVDAATLLAMEQGQEETTDVEEADPILESTDGDDVEETSRAVEESDSADPDAELKAEETSLDKDNRSRLNDTPNLTFGPAELCSLAWAATELKDSLRLAIVKQVTRNVFLLGPSSLSTRSGSALSSLSQTISNAVVEGGGTDLDYITVLDWIAEEAYACVDPSDAGVRELKIQRLMKRFHPPSLSHLVFAVAAARCSTGDFHSNKSVVGLVSLALDAAFENPDVFGPEDLACIVFAHLEVAYPSLSNVEKSLAEHRLGVLLEVIEIALLNWESGASRSSSPKQANPTPRGLSFFGRRWFDFDHHLEHDSLQEEHDELDGMPGMLTEKAHRPLLRDFPIDPSTLSKLTWSSSRLSNRGSASDTLSRVALQLFTSKSGRLLRECEAFDLSSITRAADTVSSSRREMVSLFTRRLVRVLNESPKVLGSSPPIHSASLLFSLGRLGVKYRPDQHPDKFAYRRLQLTSPLPNFSKAELEKLPTSTLVHMLRAIGTLDILDYDTDFVEDIISAAERRLPSIDIKSHGNVVRGLVEGLGAILALIPRDAVPPPPKSSNATESFESEESTRLVDISEINQRCKDLLVEIANNILLSRLGDVMTSDIRRVVHVYAVLPIRADALIDEAEAEIESRKNQYLHESEIQYNPAEVMSQIAANADFVRQALSGGKNTGKGFSILRNGLLKTLFRSSGSGDTNEDNQQETEGEAETATKDETAAARNLELVQALDYVIAWGDALSDRSKTRKEGDDKGECSVLVELGRCQELIAHYRRHDFDSGTRRSRLDEDSRRDMTKRLVSRFLP